MIDAKHYHSKKSDTKNENCAYNLKNTILVIFGPIVLKGKNLCQIEITDFETNNKPVYTLQRHNLSSILII